MQPSFTPESAPLEVDRVEWLPASPEAVHVHVLGRWKDRPVTEPLVLLVGTERRRHAFDALAEPPAGVLAAFAVPNELRSRLGIDIALQIGSNELALPGAGTGTVREGGEVAAEDEEGEVIDRAVLAERRARRAELAEEQLERRASEAEQTAGTLEAQLANLEERLAQARDERDELQASLSDAEGRLKSAQQREYAEQQQRIDAQDELEALKRGQEDAVADVRRRLDAANERAEDMAREVDRARRGIAEANQRAEADRAALQRAEEQLRERSELVRDAMAAHESRGALEAAFAEVETRAAELQASLAAEHAARAGAEAALVAEREEAAAKVTLLEHELESRAAVQERIVAQLTELRSALADARADAARRDTTVESVERLSATADRLKDRIVDLERRKDVAEAELLQTREILTERSAELERAKIDLARAESDAARMRQEAGRHEAALEQSQRTIEAVRTSAGELQLRLDEERRERAQAEAALHEELSRARAEGQRGITDIEVELRMALETEREKFAAQVATIEQHVGGLREQVATAAAGLRDSLDTERAARQAAERQLAEAQERVTTERTAAAEAMAQLALEQARRAELEEQVAEALAAVRTVRTVDEERNARDAAVQRLVSEVLGTAASLREAFEAESRKLEGELTAQVVAERKRMAEELQAMESRAGDLQTELHGAGEELAAELAAERQARWLAEGELARERQRSGGADRSAMEQELGVLREELARVQRVASEQEAATGEARAIIDDLTSAAQRLRDATPPQALGNEEGEAPTAAADRPQVRIPPPSPIIDPEEPAELPAESALAQGLAPRLVSAAERPHDPWLARSITRLAARDPETAARLVVALLPVQRLAFPNDTTYDLTVTELGTFRVMLEAAATAVEPRVEPGTRKEIDFHLEGSAAELAEFAAGGIRKRPKGTHLEGSRRKLKRLLKELRDPVQLPDVARSGAVVEAGLVLAALAAGIDPGEVSGHTFTVTWRVTGQRGGTWTVRVGEGFPTVEPGEPDGGATATVTVPQGAFLPLLADVALPPGMQATVTGNANAVALLRAWFDHAQGLA